MSRATLRHVGQFSMGPNGVRDQSFSLMRHTRESASTHLAFFVVLGPHSFLLC
jgi:hypothetical protein